MRFNVKVIRGGGAVAVVPVDAASASIAVEELRRDGFTVLSVDAARGAWRSMAWRRAPFPLLLFSQQVIALLAAGLNVLEALEALAENEHSDGVRRVLGEVLARVREGRTFSQALATRPDAFPAFFVASIRASERTAGVEDALRRFVRYQEQMDIVRSKVVSASIYPMLLLGAGALVMAFLLGYVVPRFAIVFADSRTELPWTTQLLVAWGGLVQAHGAAALVALAAVAVGVAFVLSRPQARASALSLAWRIGPLADRMRLYQLARFYRTLGMLLAGGIPIVQAFDMAGGMVSGRFAGQVATAKRRIEEGMAASAAMDEAGLSTPVALRLMRVGERSGALGAMMDRIGSFLDDEIARWIDWFTRLFEPLLMAAIGGFIGLIVALMYMPIFELASGIQ